MNKSIYLAAFTVLSLSMAAPGYADVQGNASASTQAKIEQKGFFARMSDSIDGFFGVKKEPPGTNLNDRARVENNTSANVDAGTAGVASTLENTAENIGVSSSTAIDNDTSVSSDSTNAEENNTTSTSVNSSTNADVDADMNARIESAAGVESEADVGASVNTGVRLDNHSGPSSNNSGLSSTINSATGLSVGGDAR